MDWEAWINKDNTLRHWSLEQVYRLNTPYTFYWVSLIVFGLSKRAHPEKQEEQSSICLDCIRVWRDTVAHLEWFILVVRLLWFCVLLVFMFYSIMKRRQSHMRRGQTEPLVTGNAFGLSRHFDLVTFLSYDFDCLLKHGPFLLLNRKANLV